MAGDPTAGASAATPQPLAGCRVSTSGLGAGARDAAFALIRQLGGQTTSRLDRRCSHLILDGMPSDVTGAKYDFARRYNIHIVAPEFLWASAEAGARAVESEFAVSGLAGYNQIAREPNLFDDDNDTEADSRFLRGQRAVIHLAGCVPQALRNHIAQEVARAGGQVRLAYLCRGGCTHVLCATRGDPAYALAAADGCPVVNPLWWQECMAQKTIHSTTQLFYSPPLDSERGVEGMATVRLTVTGLSGNRRREVRELLQLLGGEFSGSLRRPKQGSGSTHLICEQMAGAKYFKACEWGVKVVRAAWLQDCFKQWRLLPEAGYLLHPGVPPGTATVNGCAASTHENNPSTVIPACDSSALSSSGGGWKRQRVSSSHRVTPRSKKIPRLQACSANYNGVATASDEDRSKELGVLKARESGDANSGGADRATSFHSAVTVSDVPGFRFQLSGGKTKRKLFAAQIDQVCTLRNHLPSHMLKASLPLFGPL